MSAGPLRPRGRPPGVAGHVTDRGMPGIIDNIHLGLSSSPVKQIGVGDGRGRMAGHVIAAVQ